MTHIQKLNINSFRGIQNLKLENLANINILLGKNNSGKTSILEAISVLEYPSEIGNYIKATSKRDTFGSSKLSYYSSFINTFNKNNDNQEMKIDINALIKNKKIDFRIFGEEVEVLEDPHYVTTAFEGILKFNNKDKKISIDENTKALKINPKDSFKTTNIVHISSFDYMLKDLTNNVIKSGNKEELINIIRVFDKDIIGLEMIGEKEKIVTYIQNQYKGLMPLSTYGDGLRKVLLMASAVVQAKDGVLLIDEVETGIHYSALVEIFRWFIKVCKKFNVQVFMTSHSIEVVDAIIESIDDSDSLKESLRVITLKKNENSDIKVRILDGFEVYKSREEYNLELR